MSGMTLEQVAGTLPGKVSRVAVGFWESENPENRTEPRRANREALAALYGLTVSELMSDSDNVNLSKFGAKVDNAPDGNIGEVVGTLSRIPIIDIVQAGSPSDYFDPYQPGEANEWIATINDFGNGTFALRVDGTSMVQESGERSYPHGSIIVCDPSLAPSVRIGDDVVARLLSDDSRVFKSFDMVDGKPALLPRNKQYPVIFEEFEILAVVVQLIIQRR